jgi:hypothetical protein
MVICVNVEQSRRAGSFARRFEGIESLYNIANLDEINLGPLTMGDMDCSETLSDLRIS